ncbi:MAG TPA: type II toxin-antitoxin system RelE/ParE family toxin, partial [Polyangia bacterium]
YERRRIMDAIDEQLTRTPASATRRKKLLRGLTPPWSQARPVWQLRVGAFRVFYDVDEDRREVIVRAARRKGARMTKEVL